MNPEKIQQLTDSIHRTAEAMNDQCQTGPYQGRPGQPSPGGYPPYGFPMTGGTPWMGPGYPAWHPAYSWYPGSQFQSSMGSSQGPWGMPWWSNPSCGYPTGPGFPYMYPYQSMYPQQFMQQHSPYSSYSPYSMWPSYGTFPGGQHYQQMTGAYPPPRTYGWGSPPWGWSGFHSPMTNYGGPNTPAGYGSFGTGWSPGASSPYWNHFPYWNYGYGPYFPFYNTGTPYGGMPGSYPAWYETSTASPHPATGYAQGCGPTGVVDIPLAA